MGFVLSSSFPKRGHAPTVQCGELEAVSSPPWAAVPAGSVLRWNHVLIQLLATWPLSLGVSGSVATLLHSSHSPDFPKCLSAASWL